MKTSSFSFLWLTFKKFNAIQIHVDVKKVTSFLSTISNLILKLKSLGIQNNRHKKEKRDENRWENMLVPPQKLKKKISKKKTPTWSNNDNKGIINFACFILYFWIGNEVYFPSYTNQAN